jgi:hypothetical protein
MARPVAAFRSVAALALAALLCSLPGSGRAWDRGADGNFDQRTSAHFVLYQDVDIDERGGFHGSRRFERQVLDELERAYDGLESLLGLRPTRKIDVVIYDPELFDQQFRGLFRFPAAGFYQGVIRVRGATRLSVELSRVLHHELVHAALDAAAPALVFPGWVNEGGAEWFEARALGKRGLSPWERAALAQMAGQGELHALQTLNVRAFSGMGPRQAQAAYLQSYALIEFLVRRYGERKLPRFYEQLMQSRNLERALDRVYRLDSRELEAALLAELG